MVFEILSDIADVETLQREPGSGKSPDCEKFVGAVDGVNARGSLAFG
jgi:hypothetical protein